jgi:hypothetical protein
MKTEKTKQALNNALHKDDNISSIFINPNGVLCKTVVLFGKPKFTMINVKPRFDGYDVNGKIINQNDWGYEHCL